MAPTTLTIVVPVFNEERRLPSLLERLATEADTTAANADLALREVILVDDGSTDETPRLLAGFGGMPGRVQVLRFDRNRGKGAAVRAGMLASTSSVALMTDVDLSTPLDELIPLAGAIAAGADIAIASRAHPESQIVVHQPILRELMGKTFNLAVRLLTRVPWKDTQCGFKLFRSDTALQLFELQRVEGFAFDLELLVTAQRLGLEVVELPVRWIDDPDTRVGIVGSSAAMALDAIRIAFRARRPLVRTIPR
jgi:dolichyl-phosphate beta-glucosyltransferase